MALALAGLWAWKLSGRSNGDPLTRGARRKLVLAEVGRASAWAAVLALGAFLLIAPRFLRETESNYVLQIAWLTLVEQQAADIAAAEAKILADPVQMESMRVWAAEQLGSQAPP